MSTASRRPTEPGAHPATAHPSYSGAAERSSGDGEQVYPGQSGPSDSGPSTAELVRRATEQTSRLVREEVRLAQAELKQKGRRAGMGAGLLGAGAVIAAYGVGALIATLILLLDLAMPAWVAALIVSVALLLAAAVAALIGKQQLSRAAPPMPAETASSVKSDVQRIREKVRE